MREGEKQGARKRRKRTRSERGEKGKVWNKVRGERMGEVDEGGKKAEGETGGERKGGK